MFKHLERMGWWAMGAFGVLAILCRVTAMRLPELIMPAIILLLLSAHACTVAISGQLLANLQAQIDMVRISKGKDPE